MFLGCFYTAITNFLLVTKSLQNDYKTCIFIEKKTAANGDLWGFMEVKNGRVVKPVTACKRGVTRC